MNKKEAKHITRIQRDFLRALVSEECAGDTAAACAAVGIEKDVYLRWYTTSAGFRREVTAAASEMARSRLPAVWGTLLELITVKKDARLIKLYFDLTGNDALPCSDVPEIKGEEELK